MIIQSAGVKMHVSFPHMLRHRTFKPEPFGRSRDTQQAINEAMTVVPALSGHWRMAASFWITSEATELAWNAFLACMEGRVGTTLFPISPRYPGRDQDGHRASRYGTASLGNDLPYEGAGSQMWDHSGFQAAAVVTAGVVEAADLRATRIKIENRNTTGLRPGQYFSIGQRLYWAQMVWDDGGVETVQFWPPLRAAVEAGAEVVLDRPHCLMRFATDQEGILSSTIDVAHVVEVNMVEVI